MHSAALDVLTHVCEADALRGCEFVSRQGLSPLTTDQACFGAQFFGCGSQMFLPLLSFHACAIHEPHGGLVRALSNASKLILFSSSTLVNLLCSVVLGSFDEAGPSGSAVRCTSFWDRFLHVSPSLLCAVALIARLFYGSSVASSSLNLNLWQAPQSSHAPGHSEREALQLVDMLTTS